MSENNIHRDVYLEEARELLAELETALLELEERPEDIELVRHIFRALHTIKGSGAMFGFDDVAEFTHHIENIFDMVRNNDMEVTKELIDITLASRDHIEMLLESVVKNTKIDINETTKLVDSLKKLMPNKIIEKEHNQQTPSDADGSIAKEEPDDHTKGKKETYRINFDNAKTVLIKGTDILLLLKNLTELGECNIMVQTDEVPLLHDCDPETCYLNWDIIITTKAGINALKDVFIFIMDDCEVNIKLIYSEDNCTEGGEANIKKLGEILVERGTLKQEDLKKTLSSQKRIGEMLIKEGLATKEEVQAALLEQQHIKKTQSTQAVKTTSSIRVASEKLDSLVNRVGELVIVQARLSQLALNNNDQELIVISEEVERLTADLRDSTLSIRMLPIGTTFSKFKRLVRDLANDLGKKVEMTTEGAETELDKTVIERLNDPLVHLIRNCIDHGLESPAVRKAAGKSEHGTVHLTAAHSGADVLIQIKDDGKGLDLDKIREKAIEKKLISKDTELSEKQIYSLVFTPGFSTSETLSNISGRGVGMDIVKQAIESLHGSVEISSKENQGTTVTIRLPLTLAIIEGLQVVIENDVFVLPLANVEECIELTKEDIAKAHGRCIVNVRDEIVPYISLREWFIMGGDTPDVAQIVITKSNNKRVGFMVDNVLGSNQTVIKGLGSMYKNLDGVSGATILGNGNVALILDVQQLIQLVENEEIAINNSNKQLSRIS